MRMMIRIPDNFHCHLREGPLLPFMVKHLVESGFRGRVLAEPNLTEAVLNRDRFMHYADEVSEAKLKVLGSDSAGFETVFTIQITEETTPKIIYEAYKAGVRVAKVYPRDVTTNSKNGVSDDYTKIYGALTAAQDCGMVVQFHGEHPSKDIQGPAKETDFIYRIMVPIVAKFPRLKIVLEHISTSFAVHWVRSQNPNSSVVPRISASITPHHLFYTSDDVEGYTERSNYKANTAIICKPKYKWNEDRATLRAAATSGDPWFFYGGDDAAHFDSNKGLTHCNCGNFNTRVALPVLAEVFEERNALERLDPFLSKFGCGVYGYPPNEDHLILEKDEWRTVPAFYEVEGTNERVTPMLAGERPKWRLIA